MAITQVDQTDSLGTYRARLNEVITEINNIGDVGALTTTATDIAAAVNELDGEIGDLSTLTTTAQDSVVNAINELDSDLGSLVIGTDVQAFDAVLDGIAGVTVSAADKGIYSTAENTFATFDISTFGRSLVGSSNSTDARATMNVNKATLGWMTDLVDDTTPQLGGNLDGQDNRLVNCEIIDQHTYEWKGTIVDGDYTLFKNVPYAHTITEVRAIAEEGTATFQFKLGSTNFAGGSALSVADANSTESYSASASVGNDINVTVSAASGLSNVTLYFTHYYITS